MELTLLIYLISMLESFKNIFQAVIFLSCCIGAVSFGIHMIMSFDSPTFYSYDNIPKEEKQKKWDTNKLFASKSWKICLGIASVFSILYVMVPSEKTAYMMVGGYATQQVAQSAVAKKVLEVVNTKVDLYLDEALETAKKKATK